MIKKTYELYTIQGHSQKRKKRVRKAIFNIMNSHQSQHKIKKINIALNLNNKHILKNRESFGLGLHIRENKSGTFKSILQKIYQSKNNKPKNDISIDRHSRVSSKKKITNESIDKDTSIQHIRLSRQVKIHQEEQSAWAILNKSSKRMRRVRRQNQSKKNSVLTESPFREMADSLVFPLQQNHNRVQKDRQSIDPYTNSQYRYIQHAHIDSNIISRCATSKKRFSNNITSSYKVSSIKLEPHQTRKRLILSQKQPKSRQLSLNQKKIKIQRKSSELIPWQWPQKSKSQSLMKAPLLNHNDTHQFY